ncbi:ABC transporter ATP-binding protein [Inconstantimicrobium mannanitabidum]|uniref:ABC transporter ATP-binding protein n=1 Tax=Inconstantimicrobium mannanitabidum TaxID=1604901 RepID=A0ACB5RFS3_9CLOT|nr:ABC transporter ATP-binding protein [Clostridium sp. TW13]GKX67946.1 ABC transporter ATP-binding protein [Clostridium sp. TW13]
MKNSHFKAFAKDCKSILSMVSGISKSFIVLIFVQNIIKATIPYINIIFSSLILDNILSNRNKEIILNYVYWMVGINLVFGILNALLERSVKVKKLYIELYIKSKLAEKALMLDYEVLEKKETLDLLHKAEEGVNSNGGIYSFLNTLGDIISDIISLICSIVLLSSLFIVVPMKSQSSIMHLFNSPLLAVLLFGVMIISILLNFGILNKQNVVQYKFFEKNVDSNRKFGYFVGLPNNYKLGKDIRIYNMCNMIMEEMWNAREAVIEDMREIERVFSRWSGLMEINNQAVMFLTYGYVGVKGILGLISVSSVLKYVSTITKFTASLSGVVQRYAYLNLQRQYLNNYCYFLDLENVKYQGTLPVEKRDDNEYEIEFKNVSFHYPNSEDLILDNVSLKLSIGNKMSIVGKNGAGKTTFIKLLCRIYDPTEGEILLNGINIKKYDYAEYLRVFSVVFQDFNLFSFPIAENVAASVEVDKERAWETLEQAGVAERIRKMKDGLGTNLYQNEKEGVEISGGEAQKIAIARALYKDAPLVILDEPTSALDPISEYEIYSKFNELVLDKTSIFISHRMSSCRFCDNIVVFDAGKIVQVGNHDTLIKDEAGLYYKLWTSQAQYYVS